ncbi:hypothetical protein PLESTF_000744800 [Pleodorina starrii]|nr:hypothetical protein PLESTF_000744800 [Pleodorina starrii]
MPFESFAAFAFTPLLIVCSDERPLRVVAHSLRRRSVCHTFLSFVQYGILTAVLNGRVSKVGGCVLVALSLATADEGCASGYIAPPHAGLSAALGRPHLWWGPHIRYCHMGAAMPP